MRWGLLLLFVALSSLAQQETVDVRREVERFVEDQAGGIKLQLQSRYAVPGLALLPQRKEAVDSVFAAVLLPSELGDAETKDWCRLFRYDYAVPAPRRTDLDLPAPAEWAAIFAPYRIGEGQCVQFSARLSGYAYVGGLYPVVLWVDVALFSTGGVFRVRACEPLMANRDLAFPMHPLGLSVQWTLDVIRYFERYRTTPVAETPRARQPKAFNNYPGIYTIGDSLQLAPFLSTKPGDDAGIEEARTAGVGPRVVLRRDDGSLLRTTRLDMAGGRLKAIHIRQEPLALAHRDVATFNAVKAVDDGALQQEVHRLASRLPYLERGREIDIEFGASRAGNVPNRMAITDGGEPRFEALFTDWRQPAANETTVFAGRAPDGDEAEANDRMERFYSAVTGKTTDWRPHYYAGGELAPGGDAAVLRLRLKYNAYAAMVVSDHGTLSRALQIHRELLRSEGLSGSLFVFGVEALTQAAFDHRGEDAGWAMADRFLRAAYAASDTRELTRHAARLMDQYRFGYALLALRIVSTRHDLEPKPRSWAVRTDARLRALLSGREKLEGPWHNTNYANCVAAGRVIAARLPALAE